MLTSNVLYHSLVHVSDHFDGVLGSIASHLSEVAHRTFPTEGHIVWVFQSLEIGLNAIDECQQGPKMSAHCSVHVHARRLLKLLPSRGNESLKDPVDMCPNILATFLE
eukprot:CAMPEP_0196584504 /NCGR_PEP_ID=MMETSP1081-20130531/47257_1 /TAXON_ID=36882 /ORGANISM="Pyramimonas amylifera, Strain CCMP720" /LENGTH=107 /DNA_ID=CAMNT_0041905725 /DNA_START=41 /DNA_END=364 /DNA_ORIENTATION=+